MKLILNRGLQPQLFEFKKPALLSELLSVNGIPFDMPCGGRQCCLKCRLIASGALSPPSEKEAEFLTDAEKDGRIRLACMTTAIGDVEITLPMPTHDQILTDGQLDGFIPEPWGKQYGVAVDIGTTTVAAFLYALPKAKLLHTAACLNPQAAFGADVISRIEKSLNGQRETLSQVIRSCITEQITALCNAEEISLSSVDSLVLTGNTAMLYLLCGQNPASIATAPFKQDRFFGEFVHSAELGLTGLDAQVYLTRSISAYVGGDITTAMLSSGVFATKLPALLVDIGTNGEMVLHTGNRLLACSTAAGPAFEGAGITMGMHASDGAVNTLRLAGDRIHATTIGDKEALGICGSGIVDAIAVLLDAEVLDETGRFVAKGHAFEASIVDFDGKPAFKIPGTNVLITQKDVRAVQLAKSAICAGIVTLLKSAGLAHGDLNVLLIAGGFGSYLNVYSAQRIGLIPAGFAARARSIGNAAAMGAAMALLSRPMLEKSELLARETETVELSTNAVFSEAYIDGMSFEYDD